LESCIERKDEFFSSANKRENIAVIIIPNGECINCKTMLYKNTYTQLLQQYSNNNIYFLFKDLRLSEAEHFLKFNISKYNKNQIIINKQMFEKLWKQLAKKEASVLIINNKMKILLQKPIKRKIIKDYNFLLK
jgi:hypothetical protein